METSIAANKKEIKTNKITTSLDFLTHCLCFLSILLIGADTWGVNIGVNLRLDQIFLLLMSACLLINNGYRVRRNYSVIVFLVLCLFSVFFAFNTMRSVLFYFSIVFNVFLVFYSFLSYILLYGFKKIIKICRYTIYIQAGLIIFQFLLKISTGISLSIFNDYGYYMGIPRFCLWFYEPSYFATYFVFWFAFSFYQFILNHTKGYFKDVLLCGIAILLSTSGTGYAGLIIVVVLVYLIWISRSISTKKVLFFFLLVGVAVALYMIFRSTFDTFLGRIFSDGLDNASGGRVDKWSETYEVFKENILFGVGPGNYGLYLGKDNTYVPSNVTLELLATTGLFATIMFYMITVELGIRAHRVNKQYHNSSTRTVMALFFALIMFTIILQVNQGYLRLYHWMFFGLIDGGVAYSIIESKKAKDVVDNQEVLTTN